MGLKPLRHHAYDFKLWNNGGGMTQEVWLWPETAIVVFHIVQGSWRIAAGDAVMEDMHDSVVVEHEESIHLETAVPASAVMAVLQPAGEKP